MLSEIDKLDEKNRLCSLDALIRVGDKVTVTDKTQKLDLLQDCGIEDNIENMPSIVGESEDASVDMHLHEGGDENLGIVRKVLQKLHHTQADLRAADLQTNHMKLQLQALSASEQQVRSERDLLEYAAAESEQDKLLLETRLKEIAGFEGLQVSVTAADIRGELLHLANEKIAELMNALQLQDKEMNASSESARVAERQNLENKALRAEIDHLSNQLAQRTVLYSAQERRLHNNTRANHAVMDEKDTQIAELRARLQDLERRYEGIDRERIESIFSERQTKEAYKAIEVELANALERAQQLDTELTGLNTQNISLHATVEHLRGANYDDVERDLAADVETIRAESNAREDQLRMQLDSARSLLAQEADRRETVLDEVAELRRELADKEALLRAVQNQSQSQNDAEYSPHRYANNSHTYMENVEDDEELTEIASASPDTSGEREDRETDAEIFAAMFDRSESSSPRVDDPVSFYNDDTPQALYGSQFSDATLRVLVSLVSELVPTEDSNASVKSLLDSLNAYDGADAAEYRVSLQNRIALLVEHEYNHSDDAFDGSFNGISQRLVEVLTAISRQYGAIETSFHQRLLNESFAISKSGSEMSVSVSNSQSVSRGFLTGAAEPQDDDASAPLIEELTALKNELAKRKRHERRLSLALQQQRQQLAIVLERAASLPPSQQQHVLPLATTSSSVQTLDDTSQKEQQEQLQILAALETERDILRQKVDGYSEEIAYLTAQVDDSRQLGFHEAAELHASKVRELEAELQETAQLLRKTVSDNAEEKSTDVKVLEELAKVNTELVQLKKELEDADQKHAQSRAELVSEHRIALNTARVQLQAQFEARQQQTESRHGQELGELYEMRSRITQEHATQLEEERASMQEQMERTVQALREEHTLEMKKSTVGAIVSTTNSSCNTDTEYFSPLTRVHTVSGVVDTMDQAAQTVFNVGDSQVDQRMEFALAHQRLQDDNKLTHELEMQKLTLEREHQLHLHDKIAALHKEYEAQLLATKQKVTTKYRGLLEKQRLEFESLKGHLTEALALDIKQGDEDIGEVLRSSLTGSLRYRAGPLYPEMIPPEATEAVIQKVVQKAQKAIPVASPPRSHASAFDALIAVNGEDGGNDVSRTDSSMTLSPARWDADMSLGNITSTPVIDRSSKASSRSRHNDVKQRKIKETSPITLQKTSRASPRVEQLSKPKKGVEFGALRSIRRFPLKI